MNLNAMVISKVNIALSEVMVDLTNLIREALNMSLQDDTFRDYLETASDLELKLSIEAILVEVAAVDILNRLNPKVVKTYESPSKTKIAAVEYLLNMMKRQQLSS